MSEPTDRQLLELLGGSLEPPEAADATAAVAGSADARARLTVLGAELDQLVVGAPRTWVLPPPTWAPSQRPFLRAAPLGLLGDDAVRVGAPFELSVAPHDAPETVDVFVLRRVDGEPWSVVFPTASDERLPLAAFDVDEEGRASVQLIADGPPGIQRFAVVLAPTGLVIDWSQAEPDRSTPLRDALATGQATSSTVDIDVEG